MEDKITRLGLIGREAMEAMQDLDNWIEGDKIILMLHNGGEGEGSVTMAGYDDPDEAYFDVLVHLGHLSTTRRVAVIPIEKLGFDMPIEEE